MSTSATPVHDNDFYLDTVVFRVENRLFKVYRHHFVQSEVFNTTFTLPSGHSNAEGRSDENPFVLHGIMADDFHAFLKVMTQLISEPLSMTREEWTSALKLSTMWEFADVRERTIASMSKLDLPPVDKILLGKKYRVTTWLEEGYRALIQKGEAITPEELEDHGRLLGWETVARMLRVRDHFAQGRRGCGSCHRGTMALRCSHCRTTQYTTTTSPTDYDAEIRREFRSDFRDQDDHFAVADRRSPVFSFLSILNEAKSRHDPRSE